MTKTLMTRRSALTLAGAALIAPAAYGAANGIHVVRDRNCGCCHAWIEILEREGFAVTVEDSLGTALVRYKLDNGIPEKMMSCHTGRIEGYMIEGHVPVDDIRRLLEERPNAVGLAVPGMPYGSPGMGPESEREAYDVFLIGQNGAAEVFTSYPAA